MAWMGGKNEQGNSSYAKAGSYGRAGDFLGCLIPGTLDALEGVIAYGTRGLNPIQVLQYIASGALGKAAFQGGLGTAALGATFHFLIAWVAGRTNPPDDAGQSHRTHRVLNILDDVVNSDQ
jgi:hypothetical protein